MLLQHATRSTPLYPLFPPKAFTFTTPVTLQDRRATYPATWLPNGIDRIVQLFNILIGCVSVDFGLGISGMGPSMGHMMNEKALLSFYLALSPQ